MTFSSMCMLGNHAPLGRRLIQLAYNECLERFAFSSWPKTLHLSKGECFIFCCLLLSIAANLHAQVQSTFEY